MRALSSLVLVASSSFLLACSLDTEAFTFADTPGAGGAGAGQSGAGGSSAGQSGAGGGSGASGATTGGSAGVSQGGSDSGGAGGSEAGAGGSEAGAGGDAGTGGTGAGTAGSGGAAGASGTAGNAGAAGSGGAPQMTCTAALEGATRCVGKTVETCTSDAWVPDAAPCALDCFQKGVTATCTACVPSTVTCEADVLQTCKADGTAFTSVSCAATSKICDPTLHQCVTCTPNTTVCVFGAAVKCDATGSPDLVNGVPCGSTSLCEDGTGCKAPECKAGEFKCMGQQIQSCLADGTAYGAPAACSNPGETCFDDVGCAECNQKNGATFCVKGASSTCIDGRVSTLARCPVDECDANTGLCTSCTVGSTQCSLDGLGISTCVDGSGFPAPSPCATGTICDAGLGQCVPCHPNEFSCSADTLTQCRADGSGPLTSETCGPELCDAAQGRCDACKAGDKKCSKGQVLGCNAAGDYEKLETCATADLCDEKNAACLPPACDVGELDCTPKGELRVCNASRTDYEFKDECKHGCVKAVGCVEAQTVFSGPTATCAIVDKGALIPVCWGLSTSFLLSPSSVATETSPHAIKGLTGVTKMAIGPTWACVVSVAGDVSCWGANGRGQLGQGDKVPREQPTPVSIPGSGPVTDISSAGFAVCAVKGGEVYCWGEDANNMQNPQALPTKVIGATNAVAIQVSGSHRCYTNNAGQTYCWGYNREGQLGNGKAPIPPSNPFVPLGDPVVSGASATGLTGMSSVTTGGNHACAIIGGGATGCWGGNNAGQLAIKTTVLSSPVATKGAPSGLLSIAAGRDFTCAISGNGELLCWGQGADYQTGREDKLTTPEVNTLSAGQVSSLALGEKHGCVVSNGDVLCWGSNANGTLGLPSGKVDHAATPIRVNFP